MSTNHHGYHGAGSTKNSHSIVVVGLGEIYTIHLQNLIPWPKRTLSWTVWIHFCYNYSLRLISDAMAGGNVATSLSLRESTRSSWHWNSGLGRSFICNKIGLINTRGS